MFLSLIWKFTKKITEYYLSRCLSILPVDLKICHWFKNWIKILKIQTVSRALRRRVSFYKTLGEKKKSLRKAAAAKRTWSNASYGKPRNPNSPERRNVRREFINWGKSEVGFGGWPAIPWLIDDSFDWLNVSGIRPTLFASIHYGDVSSIGERLYALLKCTNELYKP